LNLAVSDDGINWEAAILLEKDPDNSRYLFRLGVVYDKQKNKTASIEAMRRVMRFAGPRMMLRHPWLSIVHLWKERFRTAPRPKTGRGAP